MYKEFEQTQNVEIDGSLTLNGVTIPSEVIKTSIIARIWASAVVNKNKRALTNKSISTIIAYHLKEGSIDKEQALDIMLFKDKEKIQELKDAMPKVEVDKEPSQEDFELAEKQFFSNGGQRGAR